MATLQERVEQLINVNGQALGVLKTLTTLVGSISGRIKSGPADGGSRKAPAGGGPDAGAGGTGALGRVAGAIGTVGAVAAGVSAALAAVPAAVAGAVVTANRFVRALNPALVERYGAEVENLTATIGFGLTPIVAYATRSVREFSQQILPAVQAVKPAVEALARGVAGVADAVGRFVAQVALKAASVLAQLAPFVEQVAGGFADLIDVAAAVLAAMQPLSLVVDFLRVMLQSNVTTLGAFARALAVASARLLGAFGGAEVLNRFKAALSKAVEDRKRDPTGGLLAAPRDATTGGIEDVIRRMNERAFLAGAGAETKPPDVAALEAILAEVQGLEPESWRKVIADAVREGVRVGILGGTGTGAGRVVGDAIGVSGASTGGRSIMGALAGVLGGG